MRTQALIVFSAVVLAAFGGKRPKTSELKGEDVPKTPGPAPVTHAGLRVHLTRMGKDYVIGKTGELRFENQVPGGSTGQRCEIPVIFVISGSRKNLDAAFSKTVKGLFKKLNRPLEGTTQEFTTSFFTVTETDVAPLTQASLESLTASYEFTALAALKKFGAETSAPVSANKIGFVLPVGPKFSEKIGIRIELSPADDSGTEPLCQRILQSGFKIQPFASGT